jgi:plastocyanin
MLGIPARGLLLLGFAAVSATGLVPALAGTSADSKPVTHQVVIDGVQFKPQELTVKVGESIVWVNHDPFPHTVTAAGKQFDSHEIAAGKSWMYKTTKAGVFAYACTLHPTMLGTLRVE